MSKKTSRSSFLMLIFRILFVILLLLFIVNFSRCLYSSNYVSFSGLLNWLGNVENMPININISDFRIFADWGVLNFLRNFLNVFANFLGVIVYMFANLINVIIFFGQFIGFLFS